MLSIVIALLFGFNTHTTHYIVNTNTSTLEWKGTKRTGEHFGNISIKSGKLDIHHGKFKKGIVTIDMSSITFNNGESEGDQKKILKEFNQEKFFNTTKFPEAIFKIEAIEKDTAYGNLTIKDISKPISFPVQTSRTGRKIIYDANWFSFSRKDFNLRLSNRLKNKMVNDKIQIKFHLEASF